jgi:hypothetical protein
MDPHSTGSFQAELKQWTHFPEELDESLTKAKKTGIFAVDGKEVKIFQEDSKIAFIRRILETVELQPKDLRKLMKISYTLQSYEIWNAVKDLCMKEIFEDRQSSMHSATMNFCKNCLGDSGQFEEETFIVYVNKFIETNEINNSKKLEAFTITLAMEAPALLFFALPRLSVSDQVKTLAVRFATATPLTHGLEAKIQQRVLCSISIENFIERFHVRTDGCDNIRRPLGYMTEQMRNIPVFQPMDSQKFPPHVLKFLHYANGVFKHGIVCREKAKALGILQVSSLDKFLRHPHEVEVNCVQSAEGVTVAIYHQAKGAITVATERKEDSIRLKVKNKTVTLLRTNYQIPESVEDEEALKELSERTHHCMLFIADARSLKFNDNQGKAIESGTPLMENFYKNCKIKSWDGCLEVKICSNLNPASFRAVVLSNRFESYAKYLAFPVGVEPNFVETIQPETTANILYGFRNEKDEATAVPVNIPIPNFEGALYKIANAILEEGGFVITHVTKGLCRYDPY